MARSSAIVGKNVASSGYITLGADSVGLQTVISFEGSRGCVRVKTTVEPEA